MTITQEQLLEHQRKMEQREADEHKSAISSIRAILTTSHGIEFIKYLFKSFDISFVPDLGLKEEFLREQMGNMRAAKSIFAIVSQANPEMAATILAKVEKEKHAQTIFDATETN